MALLELQAVEKRFGKTVAVTDVSLAIGNGEFVCLLGPSGSGKSTVLRMIGGFEMPTAGRVLIDGEDVSAVPPERRPTGMVFQSFALWSHMTVAENIAFGLKLRKLSSAEVRGRVARILDLVGLDGMQARRPAQLSGGQQQRVALARSLVLEPKILLLDEPFSGLDQHLRERLRVEVREIQQRVGITTIFVTHDQVEAMAVSDRIAVMSEGRLVEAGTPIELYRAPKNSFTATFLGHANIIEVEAGGTVGELPWGGRVGLSCEAHGRVRSAIRPEAIMMTMDDTGPGRVAAISFLGANTLYTVALSDGRSVTVARSGADELLAPGTPVRLSTPGPIQVLDAGSSGSGRTTAPGLPAADSTAPAGETV